MNAPSSRTHRQRLVATAQVVALVLLVAALLARLVVDGAAVPIATAVVGLLVLAWCIAATLALGREAERVAHTIEVDRRAATVLEESVAVRNAQLEDAQRVLQRMWTLGQQITIELSPERVVDRFLEAVADIVHADGVLVALLEGRGTLRVAAGTGTYAALAGTELAVAGPLERVVADRTAWCCASSDNAHYDIIKPLLADPVTSAAIVPVARRGQTIGVAVVGWRGDRAATEEELERIEAMGDLAAVSLDNATLVETLRRAESRSRTLFRAAPDAVFTVMQDGIIREANDAIRAITGWDSDRVVGTDVNTLVAGDDRSALMMALVDAFEGSPQRLAVTFQTDVETHVVALALTRVPEADPPSVLLVGRDITSEREMRSRLMEADRLAAIGELVAGVAHEVNNPLSSISAFAQLMLRDSGLTTSQRESLEVIKSETIRASQVVKDLLAFARPSEPRRELVDINAIIARTLRLRSYQLTSHRVTVDQSLAPDVPPVLGDTRQLQQVCLNLITNAIQAMSKSGAGTLTVRTADDRGEVTLEVRDTGPGIPRAIRARVFEPFFTTKPEGEGTGLGLSVSYGIVSAHGGTIDIAETSEAGTTLRVRLPGADPALLAQAPSLPPIAAARQTSALTGLRVLFVDDEPSLRSGVRSFGELRGFEVITVSDGKAALDAIAAGPVDVVVCDMRMPEMDGPALHEHLRKHRPDLAARMIFVSGDANRDDRRIPAQIQILSKPFTLDRLEDALRSVLGDAASRTPPRSSPALGGAH